MLVFYSFTLNLIPIIMTILNVTMHCPEFPVLIFILNLYKVGNFDLVV